MTGEGVRDRERRRPHFEGGRRRRRRRRRAGKLAQAGVVGVAHADVRRAPRRRCRRRIGRAEANAVENAEGVTVHVADRLGARPHRCRRAGTSTATAGGGVGAGAAVALACPSWGAGGSGGGSGAGAGAAARALPPRRSTPRRGHVRVMQLLLMPKQKVPTREAPRALGALERLLLGMGALVALEMLQPRKAPGAGGADMWPRFVGLGRWEGRARRPGPGGARVRASGCCSWSRPSARPRRSMGTSEEENDRTRRRGSLVGDPRTGSHSRHARSDGLRTTDRRHRQRIAPGYCLPGFVFAVSALHATWRPAQICFGLAPRRYSDSTTTREERISLSPTSDA